MVLDHDPVAVVFLHAAASCWCRVLQQGSELASMRGKPVSFAAIGSFAMGKLGVTLVHIR